MTVIVAQDSKILIPNKEHKNFTETNEVIEKGEQIQGEYKLVNGLRRGKPFSYRVFITTDGKILYSNNLTNMQTEVTLGADSQMAPVTVNMKPAETFKKARLIGTAIGAIGGFYYAKKTKKTEVKTIMKYSAVGGIIGYLAVWAFDQAKSVTVTR